MNNFMFYSPTKFFFGKGVADKTGPELKAFGATKVLLHYGKGSVVRSGLLDRVKKSLDGAGIAHVELGGVRPNPEVTLVREGIALARKEQIDFILCVGGGSVIDSAKAIAAGINYQGDIWDFYHRGQDTESMLKDPVPVGTVLTIPAAGSEASAGSVLSNDELQLKNSFGSPRLRPKLAFMDPELTFTLPAYQTAAGITDMYAHLCERFFSNTGFVTVTDNIALALFKSVRAAALQVMRDPKDYEARANIMWAGTLCHNGLAGCGRHEDWVTHALEHELSAHNTSVTHGAGLAVMFPAWMSYVYPANPERFALYGREVFGLTSTGDANKDAHNAIAETQRFFTALGMPQTLDELGFTPADVDKFEATLEINKGAKFGSFTELTLEDARKIYLSAFRSGTKECSL